ncbi:hypothetical protein [Iningainema tapete]|uniref:Uncharacterized protein n=1 Tax=Iningainema tapete BLCC-T55 TaxID=2748662 RepID=A0A8J7CA50_9CYAN|nr:hypothetical protein [Iningainema tapete]MBD2778904.1 hypothetical protein [Iningainema tapete BLCC-T55]
MTKVIEALQSAQFLVDANGQPIAVQLSINAWETLLNWIEDQEDKAIVKAALPKLQRLREHSDNSDWVDWSAVKDTWDSE